MTLPNIKAGADGLPGRGGQNTPADDKDVAGEDTVESENEAAAESDNEPAAETPEKSADVEADGDLRMAKTLMKRSPEKAKQRLQAIIDEFPGNPRSPGSRVS